MTILTFNELVRKENDQAVIDKLLRKGWSVREDPPKVEHPPIPDYDPDTQTVIYDMETNTYQIEDLPQETIDEIAAQKAEKAKIDNFNSKINEGFLVEPENFVLKLEDADRFAFTQMLALVKEALDLGLIDNTTIQTIADKDGAIHEIATLRFRQIMVQYGMYYKSLWDSLN